MKRSKCDMKRSNDVKRSNGVEYVAALHVGMCCWASCRNVLLGFMLECVAALHALHFFMSPFLRFMSLDSKSPVCTHLTRKMPMTHYSPKSPVCTHTTDPTPLLRFMSHESYVHTATRQSLSATRVHTTHVHTTRVHTTREIPVVFFAKEPYKRDDILQKRPLFE